MAAQSAHSAPDSKDLKHDSIAIRVSGIRKHFGNLQAVRGIDFELEKGEFLTIFGPNGAGKTTLIKMLSALTRPSGGEAFVAGYDVTEGHPAMRREIGVISHASLLYADLTPLENMLFYGKLYGLPQPEERAKEVIDEVGLKPRMHDRVRTFSRGMVQRLSIARAILHNPSILFLDEPYTGLDLHASVLLRDQLRALHTEKRTVVMTTHDFSRGLEMADRVAVQVKGRFILWEQADAIDTGQFEQLYLDRVGQAS